MAKVLVEYVRLDRAGERERESSVLLGLAGEPQTLSEIGDTPVLTAGAPSWGKDGGVIVPMGYGRVTVLIGAVLCAWGGTRPDPTKGVRIAAGREILVQLKPGEKVAFVEAAGEYEAGAARADLQASGNEHLSNLAAAAAGPGLKILPPNLRPSATTPITGVFSASGQSAPFAAELGRPINVSLTPADETWDGSVRLLRKLPGADSFQPLTMLGEPWGVFAGAISEPVWEETEAGATFVLACEHVAGSIAYRVSQ